MIVTDEYLEKLAIDIDTMFMLPSEKVIPEIKKELEKLVEDVKKDIISATVM